MTKRWQLPMSLAIMVIFFSGWTVWFMAPVKDKAVIILTPTNAEEAVPIYAQFSVRQSLVVPEGSVISGITIPLVLRGSATGMYVYLFEGDDMVYQWYFVPPADQESGVLQADFELPVPLALHGQLSVLLSAPRILPAQKDIAPRVFVEKADEMYPDGHYSIAERSKVGDVGLTVWRTRTTWQVFINDWQFRPFYQFLRYGRWVMLLVVCMAVPFLVM